jgi:hypothetical protein
MARSTRLTPSQFRQDVYRTLDRVLETGVPVEIDRHGGRLRIMPVGAGRGRVPGKLRNLKGRRYLRRAPEALVHIDWSRALRP